MKEMTPAESEWMREQAEAVRQLVRQTAGTVVRIGLILIEAKRRLGFGRFWAWVEAEFRWTRSTAHRMIQVGRVFSEVPPETLGRFCPSALYTLAKNHVPATVRAAVIEEATAGKSFNEAEVKARVGVCKPAVAPKPKKRSKKPGARTSGQPTGVPVESDAALVSLLTAGAEVSFRRRTTEAGEEWVCHVADSHRPPAEFVSAEGPLAALALAAQRPRPEFAHSAKSKKGREDRRKAVEEYVRANPLAKRKAVADVLNVTEGLVLRVQRAMGGDFARPRIEVTRELIRERLRADPTTADKAIAEELECHIKLVSITRASMEAFEGLPRMTTRTDRNGRVMDLVPLTEDELGPVDDLAGELSAA